MTVTWHWGFGDPLGARVQRLKYCAHLLAVWHVSAGKGEQLEEGAQKERTVDRWGSHGWRAAALNQSGQSRRSSGKVQRAKSYRRSQRLRWWGEAAAPGLARISILPLSSSPPLRVRALCKAALSDFLELHGCRELMTPCSFAAASVISPHRWMNAPPPDSMCALIKKRAPRREASCAYRELLSEMRWHSGPVWALEWKYEGLNALHEPL